MFLNRERAYEIIAKYNLRGLVASRPHNITYVTGYDRKLGFSLHPPIRAILSRDPGAPIVLILPAVELTTVATKELWAQEIQVNGEFWIYMNEDSVLTPIEARFRDLWTAQAKTPIRQPFEVLKDVLHRLGMDRGRVGFDESGIGY